MSPIARKVSSLGFQEIEVKRERRQQRSTEASRFRRDHEVLQTREMESAEYGNQQEKQRCDSSQAQ